MESIILTRYLYNLDEVRHSLFIEILESNYKEALYWCYELYWSGYKEETFEFLINNLYEKVFIQDEEFKKRIINEYEDWKEDNSKHEKIGNITINLCHRNYEISKLINEYYKLTCKEKQEKKNKETNLYINLKTKDIEKYETEYGETGARYKVLKKVCNYELRSEYNDLFSCKIDKERQRNMIFYNWEYYAYRCPYWKEAFTSYSGKIKQGRIVFDNEELLEEFYNKYELEIDEQPKEVQEKVLGINYKKQKTMSEFAKEFNGLLKTAKLKKKLIIN